MMNVLYVEDDTVLRTMTECDLRLAGFEVKVAIDLHTARALFSEYPFDIILLDLSLPDGNGFEWAIELKRKGNNIPFIFITSHTHITDIRKGFELGASDYIKKPFDVDELVLRMKRVLNAFGTGSGQERMVGGYLYNPATGELKFKESNIILSHLQNSVLDELSICPGQVVSKETLLRKYWGDYNYFTSRNLDSVIVKLRRQFKDDSRIYFLASKKEGYRLVVMDR